MIKRTGSVAKVRQQVKEWKKQGLTVGLVPTMGYLHEGHKSLIDRAVKENDRVVKSRLLEIAVSIVTTNN